jgi:nucleoside-diphosphate-sugar epimerase
VKYYVPSIPAVLVLVTGATGKVGNAVARSLVARGDDVRALVRDPAAPLPDGVLPVPGDVTQPETVAAPVEGCELVFNAMGIPEQWQADEETFDRVNARGTEAVVRAAAAAGVRRVVHTSTIDVFHAEQGDRFDESRLADYPKGTAYERSKQRAEQLALGAADGTEVVMVNPAAVYGLGPIGSPSFERDLFEPVLRGKRLAVPGLPPGGCGVVFSEGVAQGHLLAAEQGRPGERYILCDRHVTLRGLAEAVVVAAGHGFVPPVLPPGLARAMAALGEPVARLTGRAPLLPRGQLHFFRWNAAPDSSKAQDELGWEPTALDRGLRETLTAMDLV